MGRRTAPPTAVLVRACCWNVIINRVSSSSEKCSGLEDKWLPQTLAPMVSAYYLVTESQGFPRGYRSRSCPSDHIFLSGPIQTLPPLLQIVCKSLEDPSLVVRNAALFTLGQFSENLQVSKAHVGPHRLSPHTFW